MVGMNKIIQGKMRSIFGIFLFAAAGPALAACPAANQYNFSFANQAAANLNYATTYTYTGTSTNLGNQNFTLGFTTNGVATNLVGGATLPAINALINDGNPITANNLMIGGQLNTRTASITGTTNVIVTTFTFATPITEFRVVVNDIDFGTNQFRDWLHIRGSNGANTYVPANTSPFTNNNGTGPRTDINSTYTFGAATTPYAISANEAVGTSASANTANNGTNFASFAQPVTTVQLRYGNYPLQTGETTTGVQAFGIQNVSWCPMPALSVAKTSAPFATGATDPNQFNIPGSDTIYSLTVTNSNGSAIDASVINLADILPPQMTFFNGDIDGAGPLTGNFEFVPGTSGLTMAAGNIAYSNNSGTSYAYTPTAGYDTNVNAVRFIPQGTMAANSSFTVRFRTRIK
jgi:hypothetical protein